MEGAIESERLRRDTMLASLEKQLEKLTCETKEDVFKRHRADAEVGAAPNGYNNYYGSIYLNCTNLNVDTSCIRVYSQRVGRWETVQQRRTADVRRNRHVLASSARKKRTTTAPRHDFLPLAPFHLDHLSNAPYGVAQGICVKNIFVGRSPDVGRC